LACKIVVRLGLKLAARQGGWRFLAAVVGMYPTMGELSMQLTEKHKEYWQRNLRMTGFLLAIWFVVTFVFSYFARELNEIVFLGFPLGFYFGAQGSLIIYVVIIWYYARYMNNLDQEYGVHEGEEQ
jgi:putative solute:sodium symporter small subunit